MSEKIKITWNGIHEHGGNNGNKMQGQCGNQHQPDSNRGGIQTKRYLSETLRFT